jgi:hypothetical protein
MMHQYLFVSFTSFLYVRLKVLIWVGDGLMYNTNLSKAAGDLLNELYRRTETTKPFIVDCKGVDGLIDHSWDLFFKAVGELRRQVIFVNYLPIEEKINSSYREFCQHGKSLKEANFLSIHFASKYLDFTPVHSKSIDEKLLSNLKSYILSSYCKHEPCEMKLLSSTPFKANGEFNATVIIAEPEKFIWTCIIFADFIEFCIEKNQIGGEHLPIIFLSVSLRSSPIAAAVSLLLNRKLITIEHLGPARRYLLPQSFVKRHHYEYLYIGDFSFAGSEIRMSKMFATLTGSKLEHAFVLGSLFGNERFDDFQLHSCTDLRDVNPDAEYTLF